MKSTDLYFTPRYLGKKIAMITAYDYPTVSLFF
jgi:ketopantoate hydroxymethyltransferase